MEELLERLLEECRPCTGAGRVADYIPELAKEDPDALGVYVIGSEGKHSWAGDCRQSFTLQSVVKPVLLLHLRLLIHLNAEVQSGKIPELIAKFGRKLRFVPDSVPYFVYAAEEGEELLPQLKYVVENISGIKMSKGE